MFHTRTTQLSIKILYQLFSGAFVLDKSFPSFMFLFCVGLFQIARTGHNGPLESHRTKDIRKITGRAVHIFKHGTMEAIDILVIQSITRWRHNTE